MAACCEPTFGHALDVAETHFDGWIAEHYRTLWPELFEPALIERTVDVLADLANGGAALEFGIGTGGSRCRLASVACECMASSSPRP